MLNYCITVSDYAYIHNHCFLLNYRIFYAIRNFACSSCNDFSPSFSFSLSCRHLLEYTWSGRYVIFVNLRNQELQSASYAWTAIEGSSSLLYQPRLRYFFTFVLFHRTVILSKLQQDLYILIFVRWRQDNRSSTTARL